MSVYTEDFYRALVDTPPAKPKWVNPYKNNGQTLTPPDPRGELSTVGKSLRAFVDETQAAAGGVVEFAGAALGAVSPAPVKPYTDALTNWGKEVYERNTAEAVAGSQAPTSAAMQNMDKIKSVSDLGDWAAYQLPKGLANLATMYLPGWALAKKATQTAKATIKATAAAEAAKVAAKSKFGEAATKAAVDTAEKAALGTKAAQMQIGAAQAKAFGKGGAIGTLGFEGGLAMGEMTTGKDAVAPEDAVLPALGVGALNGAIEMAEFGMVAKYLGFGTDVIKKGVIQKIKEAPDLSKKVVELVKGVGKGAALGVPVEGGQEALQELVTIAGDRWAKDEDIFGKLSEEDWSRIRNSAAAGALVGGTAGAVLGPFQGSAAPNDLTPEQNQKTIADAARMGARFGGESIQQDADLAQQAAAQQAAQQSQKAAEAAAKAKEAVINITIPGAEFPNLQTELPGPTNEGLIGNQTFIPGERGPIPEARRIEEQGDIIEGEVVRPELPGQRRLPGPGTQMGAGEEVPPGPGPQPQSPGLPLLQGPTPENVLLDEPGTNRNIQPTEPPPAPPVPAVPPAPPAPMAPPAAAAEPIPEPVAEPTTEPAPEPLPLIFSDRGEPFNGKSQATAFRNRKGIKGEVVPYGENQFAIQPNEPWTRRLDEVELEPNELVRIEEDPRIQDPEIMQRARELATQIGGWQETGGRLIRDEEGNPVNRTVWVPKDDRWLDRPKDVKPEHIKNGLAKIEKIIEQGQPIALPARERRAVTWLFDQASTDANSSFWGDNFDAEQNTSPTQPDGYGLDTTGAEEAGRQGTPVEGGQGVPVSGQAPVSEETRRIMALPQEEFSNELTKFVNEDLSRDEQISPADVNEMVGLLDNFNSTQDPAIREQADGWIGAMEQAYGEPVVTTLLNEYNRYRETPYAKTTVPTEGQGPVNAAVPAPANAPANATGPGQTYPETGASSDATEGQGSPGTPGTLGQTVPVQPNKTEPASNLALSLFGDGIEGEEISPSRVANGNDSFQYALGKVTEDGKVAVFRRTVDQRGRYGGWRWETDADKLNPVTQAEDQNVPTKQPEVLESRPGPLWRSPLQEALASTKQPRAPAQQWLRPNPDYTPDNGKPKYQGLLSTLPGVKAEEIDDIGLNDWLETKQGPVTREEIEGFVRDGGIKVEEVIKGGEETKGTAWYIGYVDGPAIGSSFASQEDAAITMADLFAGRTDVEIRQGTNDRALRQNEPTKFGNYTLGGGENYRELLITIPKKPGFQSYHWTEPNVLAHIRFNERTDADGKKVLLVEEVQSDWHQAGRDKGYTADRARLEKEIAELKQQENEAWRAGLNGNEEAAQRYVALGTELNRLQTQLRNLPESIPDAPMKNTSTWAMLGMKRAIRWAAENGFDRVAWTPGKAQAERYDLSKQVSEIEYVKRDDDSYELYIRDINGEGIELPKEAYTSTELAGVVGKEVAEKIVKGEGRKYRGHIGRTLEGLDLKVGGQGIQTFYDKILPAEVGKYVKKFGGKVTTSQIPIQEYFEGNDQLEPQFIDAGTTQEVWNIDLTPALKEEVLKGPMLYAKEKAQKQKAKKAAAPTKTRVVSRAEFEAEVAKYLPKDFIAKAEKAGILIINETSPEGAPSGTFNTRTGVMTVNLDKMPIDESVAGVLLHEGKHRSLREMLGDAQHTKLFNDLRALAARGDAVAQRAVARGAQFKDEWTNHEEALAYYTQFVTKPTGLWRRIINAIKAWWVGSQWNQALKAKGLDFKLTDELAVALVVRAMKQDKRGLGRQAGRDQTLEMFVGEKANNIGSKKEAEELRAKGVGAEAVRKQTGWHQGKDGKWRFELDDSRVQWKTDWDAIPEAKLFDKSTLSLGEVLDAPELFAAYPDLKDVAFKKKAGFFDFFGRIQGWFNEDTNELTVTPYAQDPLSTALHEVQHWVQGKENFARGGNSKSVRLNNTEALGKLRRMMERKLSTLKQEAAPSWSSAGTDTGDNARRLIEQIDELVGNKSQLDTMYKKFDEVRDTKDGLTKIIDILDKKIKTDVDAAYKQDVAEYNKARDKINKANNDRFAQYEKDLDNHSKEWDELSEKIRDAINKRDSALADALRKERAALVMPQFDFSKNIPLPPYPSKFGESSNAGKLYKELKEAREEARKELAQVKQEERAVESELKTETAPYSDLQFELYRMIAGEAEARNTQARQKLNAEQRRNTPIGATQDVPDADLIVESTVNTDILESRVLDAINPFTMPERMRAYIFDPADSNLSLSRFERIRQYVQDRFLQMKKKQEGVKGQLPPSQQVYETEAASHGRKKDRVRELQMKYLDPMLRLAAKNGWDLEKDVGELAYARAALESNERLRLRSAKHFLNELAKVVPAYPARKLKEDWKAMKDLLKNDPVFQAMSPQMRKRTIQQNTYNMLKQAVQDMQQRYPSKELTEFVDAFEAIDRQPTGMTDTDAQHIMTRWQGRADWTDMQQLLDLFDQMNRGSITAYVQSGMMTQEMAAQWMGAYQHYATLHREGYERETGGPGMGFSPAKPSKLRFYSAKRAVNVFSNTVMNAIRAQELAENNRVMQTLHNFILAHPDEDFWEVKGKTQVAYLDDDGFVQFGASKAINPSHQALVYIKGRMKLIEAKSDNEAALSIIKALNNLSTPRLGPIMQLMMKANRFMASMNTSLSPEFFFVNPIRDLLTAQFNWSDGEADQYRKQMLKDIPAAIKSLNKVFAQRRRNESLDMNDPWTQWVRAFEQSGATTGWLDVFETAQDQKEALEKRMKQLAPGMNWHKSLHEIGQWIEDHNAVMENAVRLVTFKALVRDINQPAVPLLRAANVAKDLTVNFNRRGTAGPAINALWMFAGAGIQGSARIIMALKNRKVQKRVGAAVVVSILVDQLNRMLDDDDEYDKIPEHVKQRNLVFKNLTGVGPSYFTVPAPWGYNLFWYIGQKLSEGIAVQGGYGPKGWSPAKAGWDIAFTGYNAFMPVQGETVAQALSPTVFDPIFQIAENKDAFGRQLRPEPFPGEVKPRTEQYWGNASDFSVAAAKLIGAMTGGDDVTAGGIDLSPEWLDAIGEQALGSVGRQLKDFGWDFTLAPALGLKEFEPEQLPVIRKFTAFPTSGQETAVYHDRVAQVMDAQRRMSAYTEGARRNPEEARALRQESGELLRMADYTKDVEKQLKSIRQRMRLAESRGDSAGTKMLKDRMDLLRKRYNETFERRVGG